jgi:hypothetical protein
MANRKMDRTNQTDPIPMKDDDMVRGRSDDIDDVSSDSDEFEDTEDLDEGDEEDEAGF